MPPDTASTQWPDIIKNLANKMRYNLDSGGLARLRRMDLEGPEVAEYWHLAAQCDFMDRADKQVWKQIVRIMAILAPKGEIKRRPPLHYSGNSLGRLLGHGEAGDMPLLSEIRLMRFLSLPRELRGEALERIARMLANKRNRSVGLNCIDIAYLLLSDNSIHTQRLAKDYYRNIPRQQQEDTSQ